MTLLMSLFKPRAHTVTCARRKLFSALVFLVCTGTMEKSQNDLKSSLVGATSYSLICIHRHLKKDSPIWQKMHYDKIYIFRDLGPRLQVDHSKSLKSFVSSWWKLGPCHLGKIKWEMYLYIIYVVLEDMTSRDDYIY